MVTARTVAIAGVTIELRGDPGALALVERRYGAFLSAETGDAGRPASEISIVDLELAPGEAPNWSGEFRDISIEGGIAKLTGRDLEAEIAVDGGRARLRAPRSERAIDGVLRYVLAQRILLRGGLLVHAAAVVRDGAAWVFAGPSGSGKSTLMTTLGGRTLGDEGIVLMPEDGRVVAHATPYWSARPAQAPLGLLAFHRQRAPDAIAPLVRAQAVAKLMSCTGPLLPSSRAAALAAADALIGASWPAVAQITLSSVDSISEWLEPALRAWLAGCGERPGV